MINFEKNKLISRIVNLEKKFVEEKILCDAFPDRNKTKLNDLIVQINTANETLKTFS